MNLNVADIVPENFIEEIIVKDLKEGRFHRVQFRHPPEPSGYLHIGHVRNIYLNYGLAAKFGGVCNLRYDDTNPLKESQEFVNAIQEDVKWLGYSWDKIKFATDYFQQNYEAAVRLIEEGKAYIDDLTPEEVSAYRGTLKQPGRNSPYRDRSIAENLELFHKMKAGEFPQGKCCLRAKIDMAHPNMNMRDPVLYRIQYTTHHRIGNEWNIYPTYDFAHPLDDALEGVTHSICGPEFEDHRLLYDWVVNNSGLENKPRQIEYANLCLDGVVLGKRNIKRLVNDGIVNGFDDPRLYTICALRRRGVLPESLLDFVKAAGIGKGSVVQDNEMLNYFIRNTLNTRSMRIMAVINPVKLIITNYPEDQTEAIRLELYPQQEAGDEVYQHRFARILYVEKEDFLTEPVKKFFRLFPGNRVRLKGTYIVKCTGFDLAENGEVDCIYAEYEPEETGIKVKSTIHWVNPEDAYAVQVRFFESLTLDESGDEVEGVERTIEDSAINPDSLVTFEDAYVVGDIDYKAGMNYQFVRNGYFCLDEDSDFAGKRLVFNRTIALKDNKKRK